jgi:hypothetical protein
MLRGKRGLFTVKDHGTVYFEPAQHWFPSKQLTPEQQQEFEDAHAEHHRFTRVPKYNITQFKADADLPERLRKEDRERYEQLRARTITDHRSEAFAWTYGVPWWVADVDPRLLELWSLKKPLDQTLATIVQDATTRLCNSTYAARRYLKRIDEYVITHWNTLASVLDSPAQFKQAHDHIANERAKLEAKVKELFGNGTVETNVKDRCYDIILDKPHFASVRSITEEEILDGKICVFDIEKPLFWTPEEELSWLAAVIIDRGKVVRQSIKTLRNPGTDAINGFAIERYQTPHEIVEALTREITTPGVDGCTVDVLAPYFHSFDVEQTRAAGNFIIGERNTTPKVKVPLKFFRKDAVHGRLIIDAHSLYRIYGRHLPTRKLATVLNHAMGITNAKPLTYTQLGELERASKTNDAHALGLSSAALVAQHDRIPFEDIIANKVADIGQRCATIAGEYVAGDVQNLVELLYSKPIRDALDIGTWLSNQYKIELSRLLHTPKTLTDAHERIYYQLVGTFRDAVYPRVKQLERLKQRALHKSYDAIADWLGTSTPGIHERVAKAVLPIGSWLTSAIIGWNDKNHQARFPDVTYLEAYAWHNRHDKLRRAMIEHYLIALAEPILVSFGLFEAAWEDETRLLRAHNISSGDFRNAFAQIVQDHSPLVAQLAECGIPEQDFHAMHARYKEILIDESHWGYQHLVKGTLTREGITRHPDAAADFCVRHGISIEQLACLLAKAAKEARHSHGLSDAVRAHFNIPAAHAEKLVELQRKLAQAKKAMLGQHNLPVSDVSRLLHEGVGKLKAFLAKNRLKLIHARGRFAYLTGNIEALSDPDAPALEVEEIPRVYLAPGGANNAPKIFYKTHGAYEGIKITDRPTDDLTLYEMRALGGFLDELLAGNNASALEHARDSLDQLRIIIEDQQNDAAYWQRLCPELTILPNSSYEPYLTIPKPDLVWHTKATRRYRAFEHGKEITFVTDAHHLEALRDTKDKPLEILVEPVTNRHYFEEPQKQGEPQRVYIMPIEAVQPDISMYHERLQAKFSKLLIPIIGEGARAAFVLEPQLPTARQPLPAPNALPEQPRENCEQQKLE